MLNEDKPLQFGNPEIKLIEDKDPLDQMIERKYFPLLMNVDVQGVMKK
jgi:hypothetical protein